MNRVYMAYSRQYRLLALVFLSIFLSGCIPFSDPVEKRSVEALFVEGRIVMRSPEEKTRIDFRFTETGDDWILRLWGPFGLGRVTISGDGTSIPRVDAHGEASGKTIAEHDLIPPEYAFLLTDGFRKFVFLDELDEAYCESHASSHKDSQLEVTYHGWRIVRESEIEIAGRIASKKLRISRDQMELRVLIDKVEFAKSNPL